MISTEEIKALFRKIWDDPMDPPFSAEAWAYADERERLRDRKARAMAKTKGTKGGKGMGGKGGKGC